MTRSTPSPVIALMRRYVTDYINRHDFSVMPEFMADDYSLRTGGTSISGRDGTYRDAVAKQLEQFPGLVFTLHEIYQSGSLVAVRFTEHGASERHGGRLAAWPSIGIYKVRDGVLAGCCIEQDYFSRRRQLESGKPITVDPPATAPWDGSDHPSNPAAEDCVRNWLASSTFVDSDRVQIDDSRATGTVERIVDQASLEVVEIMSAGSHVAFHAVQKGHLADDFAQDLSIQRGTPITMYLSGLVEVRDNVILNGNIIRDRWGLYRRLAKKA
jgi:SnoaL-like domain